MEVSGFKLAGGGLLHRLISNRWVDSKVLRVGLVLLAWLPVLVLCVIDGSAVGNKVGVAFLGDPVPHARFLVAFPIFMAAGFVINRTLPQVISYIWGCNLLAGKDRESFQTAVRDAERRCDSVAADVISAIAAYATEKPHEIGTIQ